MMKILEWIGDRMNGYSERSVVAKRWERTGDVRSVLIMSEISTAERERAFSALTRSLKELCPGATIDCVAFNSKKGENNGGAHISGNGVEYINEDDLSFLYKIRNAQLLELLGRDYDLSVLVVEGRHKELDYVSRYVRSAVAVGIDGERRELNFVVSPAKDVATEIPKYLKMVFG